MDKTLVSQPAQGRVCNKCLKNMKYKVNE